MCCPCCPTGRNGEAIYQCKDCFGHAVLCQQCMVDAHQLLPLHRILVSFRNANAVLMLIDVALDRIFLFKGFTLRYGPPHLLRAPWSGLPQSPRDNQRFHCRGHHRHPHDKTCLLWLRWAPSFEYSAPTCSMVSRYNTLTSLRVHFRNSQHIPSTQYTSKSLPIPLLLCPPLQE